MKTIDTSCPMVHVTRRSFIVRLNLLDTVNPDGHMIYKIQIVFTLYTNSIYM